MMCYKKRIRYGLSPPAFPHNAVIPMPLYVALIAQQCGTILAAKSRKRAPPLNINWNITSITIQKNKASHTSLKQPPHRYTRTVPTVDLPYFFRTKPRLAKLTLSGIDADDHHHGKDDPRQTHAGFWLSQVRLLRGVDADQMPIQFGRRVRYKM